MIFIHFTRKVNITRDQTVMPGPALVLCAACLTETEPCWLMFKKGLTADWWAPLRRERETGRHPLLPSPSPGTGTTQPFSTCVIPLCLQQI